MGGDESSEQTDLPRARLAVCEDGGVVAFEEVGNALAADGVEDGLLRGGRREEVVEGEGVRQALIVDVIAGGLVGVRGGQRRRRDGEGDGVGVGIKLAVGGGEGLGGPDTGEDLDLRAGVRGGGG